VPIVIAILVIVALSAASFGQAPGNSPDCHDLKVMVRLARIGGGLQPDHVEMLGTQQRLICGSSEPVTLSRWRSNAAAKRPDGWGYPNATTAIHVNSAGIRWGYPRATTAKDPNGRLAYPNGSTARSNGGEWRLPTGAATTVPRLMEWACLRLSEEAFNARRADVEMSAGDEKDLAVIELAWSARQGQVTNRQGCR
jgi:hypothetical protein